MAIVMKKEKPSAQQIEDYVSEGGSVACDNNPAYFRKTFTLRIPEDFLETINKLRNRRTGQSQNNWILEAICERMERESAKN